MIVNNKMKKTVIYIVLCLSLAQLIYSLHLTNHQVDLHFATQTEKEAYLQQLIQIQDNLQKQIEQLIQKKNEFNYNINASEHLADAQTHNLQQALSYERNQIFTIQNGLSLPLGSKNWGCQKLTTEEGESINRQIVATQQKIHQLQRKLQNQQQCVVIDETKTQLNFLKSYVNHLSSETNNICDGSQSTPSKIFYVPYKDSGFVYGPNGKEDYDKKVKEALDSGARTLSCPQDHPFPQNEKCINCPSGTFFDFADQKCKSAPSGYIYDENLHKFVKKQKNSNSNVQNFMGTLPSVNKDFDTCPKDRSFWNGEQCISCQYPHYFDFRTKKCQGCHEGLTFSIDTKTCTFKQYNTNPQGGNMCCGKVVKNSNYETCPKQRPFFNGKKCINCELPGYFDVQTASCAYCPQNQAFSMKTFRCVDEKYINPAFGSSIDSSTQNYFGTPIALGPEYQNIEKCPQNKPFFNGKQCISCQLPSYFNFQSNKCQNCQPEYTFDTRHHKCIHKDTKKMNSNMGEINNFQGKIIPFSKDLGTCPKDKPFFNGQECISCSLPKYFDFDTSSCRECQSGKIFNTFNRQCIIENPQFYTNLRGQNIFYNGDFKKIESQISQLKKNNPQAKQCPISEPYYDAIKNICHTCQQKRPLFDYKYNRCISCGQNSNFDPQKHICLSPGNVQATIQRMIMNTVSFI